MKKLILIIAMIMGIGLVSAYVVGTIISEQQLQNIDFDTVDLDCSYGYINLVNLNGKYNLRNSYKCYDLDKYTFDSYEIVESNLVLEYDDKEFFTCVREGGTQVECFEQYVKPIWNEEVLNYEFILRAKLKAMQSGRNSLISGLLARYYE